MCGEIAQWLVDIGQAGNVETGLRGLVMIVDPSEQCLPAILNLPESVLYRARGLVNVVRGA